VQQHQGHIQQEDGAQGENDQLVHRHPALP
jgi:hypothetical protein